MERMNFFMMDVGVVDEKAPDGSGGGIQLVGPGVRRVSCLGSK